MPPTPNGKRRSFPRIAPRIPTIVEVRPEESDWRPVGTLEDISPRGIRVRMGHTTEIPAEGELRLAIAGYLVRVGFKSTLSTPKPDGDVSMLFRIDETDSITEAVLELLFEDRSLESELTRTFLVQDTRRITIPAERA